MNASTMSHSTAELADMTAMLRGQLEARARIYRVSRKINYTDDDAAVDELASEKMREAATRLEHLERALTGAREMTCGTEHCMTCGPIRRAIDRALTQSGNE